MRNIILIVLEMILCYISIIILYKKYKIDGLYVYGILATFISCIMSLKEIDVMSIAIPTGFAISVSMVIAGNIITQKKGPHEIKNYIFLILLTFLVAFLFLNLSGIMESSKYIEPANNSYNIIFNYNIKTYIALALSTIITIFLNSKLYYLIKRTQNKIILSNIFSVIIMEFLDNILFIFLISLNEFKIINVMLSIVFRYTIKTIIGIIGTIPIYITNKID